VADVLDTIRPNGTGDSRHAGGVRRPGGGGCIGKHGGSPL